VKIKLLFTMAFILFFSSQSQAAQTLSPCESEVCSQLIHNKKLEKLSVLVWDNQGNILHTNEFELDRTAKLEHESGMVNGTLQNDLTISSTNDSGAPYPPCSAGSCSTSSSTTYTTATHIVTVTITYTYYNGELVGVSTQQTSVPRTDFREEQ